MLVYYYSMLYSVSVIHSNIYTENCPLLELTVPGTDNYIVKLSCIMFI